MTAHKSRIERRAGAESSGAASGWKELERALSRGASLIEAARHRCEDLADSLESCTDSIQEEAAAEIAELIQNGPCEPDAWRAAFESAWNRVTTQVSGSLGRRLIELGDRLSETLRLAAAARGRTGPESNEVPRPAGMPIADASGVSRRLTLEQPALRLLGKGFVRGCILQQIRSRVDGLIRDSLRRFGKELTRWSQEFLSDLEQAFEAQADAYRAQVGRCGALDGDLSAEEARAVERDLEILAGWRSLELAPEQASALSRATPDAADGRHPA
jgi:hypothetical protein